MTEPPERASARPASRPTPSPTAGQVILMIATVFVLGALVGFVIGRTL